MTDHINLDREEDAFGKRTAEVQEPSNVTFTPLSKRALSPCGDSSSGERVEKEATRDLSPRSNYVPLQAVSKSTYETQSPESIQSLKRNMDLASPSVQTSSRAVSRAFEREIPSENGKFGFTSSQVFREHEISKEKAAQFVCELRSTRQNGNSAIKSHSSYCHDLNELVDH